MSPRRRDVFCEDTHRLLANGEQASAPGPKAGGECVQSVHQMGTKKSPRC